MRVLCVSIPTAMALAFVGCTESTDLEPEDDTALSESERVTQEFLTGFTVSGVPTESEADAAWEEAQSQNTVEAWELAARISNTYANVIDVLVEHYSDRHREVQSLFGSFSRSIGEDLLDQAVSYEGRRNKYLGRRNDAYLEMARLYLSAGDRAAAVSHAMTAVQLSGSSINEEGEALIREIVGYVDEDHNDE